MGVVGGQRKGDGRGGKGREGGEEGEEGVGGISARGPYTVDRAGISMYSGGSVPLANCPSKLLEAQREQ